ncbi:uncharacterized protein PAC_16436 [Phialocephala subalpina]|uniref:Extracellular membrane protein CFEM domain-containing protein n=1 Tax=Phialocephala subalpina TaxID=576137 RepID=A0A1L7XNC0_9HELO|nr:uncharacterized protein PAC_16436 [Phialocephala subalpina]
MISSIVLFLAALGTFASSASASARATPAALVPRALTPSTLTLSVTLSPSVSGASTSEQILTLTLNPTPNGGPAFTVSAPGGYPDEDGVPGDTPQCASLDALIHSCTSVASFFVLPLFGQAECLCNVGPWDAVASACFDQLTVRGQYYASSLTSHGLLDLCSTFGLGPTWPASVIASTSAMSTSAAAATDTNIETIKSKPDTEPDTEFNTEPDTEYDTKCDTERNTDCNNGFRIILSSAAFVTRLAIALAVGAIAGLKTSRHSLTVQCGQKKS